MSAEPCNILSCSTLIDLTESLFPQIRPADGTPKARQTDVKTETYPMREEVVAIGPVKCRVNHEIFILPTKYMSRAEVLRM